MSFWHTWLTNSNGVSCPFVWIFLTSHFLLYFAVTKHCHSVNYNVLISMCVFFFVHMCVLFIVNRDPFVGSVEQSHSCENHNYSNPAENAGSVLLSCRLSHIHRMQHWYLITLLFNSLEKGHTFVTQPDFWAKAVHSGQHVSIHMHYTFRQNLGHIDFMADLLLDYPLIQCIWKNIKAQYCQKSWQLYKF